MGHITGLHGRSFRPVISGRRWWLVCRGFKGGCATWIRATRL